MNNDTVCYKPSGKTSLLFFIIYLLIIPIMIPIISYIYIHIIYFMPFIYLNFLISLACGAILGLFINIAIHIGKIRNVLLTVIISLLSVIFMKYVMWTFYIPLVYSNAYEVLEYSFFEGLTIALSLFMYPYEVLEFIKEINSIGVWSFNNIDIRGIFLYIIWLGEFCILAFTCIVITYGKVNEPFCEDYNKWFKERKEKIKLNMPENISLFKEKLLTGQYDDFATLLNTPYTNSQNYLAVKLYYLDDTNYGYATIQTVTPVLDKKGNSKEKEDDFIKFLKVEGEVFTTLFEHIL